MSIDFMNKELEKLRAKEAELEAKILDERMERDRANTNITRMMLMLSDCKKLIAELTVGKMRTS